LVSPVSRLFSRCASSVPDEYSHDKRPDCVQVVIALVITPDGFPLAYEVMPGNITDKTTLKSFLRKLQNQYGKADRATHHLRQNPRTPDLTGSLL